MDPIDIVFHVGVHKTATSHLQRTLAQHRDVLSETGVAFYGPTLLRNSDAGLRDLLGVLDGQDRDQVLQDTLAGCRRLVVSEENHIGSILTDRRTLNAPPYYPTALNRITRLARRLAPHRLHIAMAVRNPASFLASAYSLSLMNGPYQTWEQFVHQPYFYKFRWTPFVQRIAKVSGAASVIVWRYEDYEDVFDGIMKAMLGPDHPPIVPMLDKTVNGGLSLDAIETCRVWTEEGRSPPFGHQARDAHPITDPSQRFQPWTDDQLARARAVYDDDMLKLVEVPGVKVL